ncbi:helix-turn-helix domain-containing protein [Agromyces mediolanus]|uniref:Helix-turn-helix domain-containing protein n=1 Tax=Agromyces mediolanus TaxID=41986 RepID=A0A918FBV9_AGRME|nr:helix-turn-helix domain-containing protein [Agromyces mediolanus]GGR28901.1 hypothetical protein GCM10010196_23460 [Agromyces mediolanus]GLJ72142.1 hypothetical protein GCM10017583_13980 [Agromyces mediolanus]
MSTQNDYNKPTFNYPTGAEYVGLSVRQLKRAAEAGKIGRYKLGGLHVRFSQAQLDAYLKSCEIAPTTDAE